MKKFMLLDKGAARPAGASPEKWLAWQKTIHVYLRGLNTASDFCAALKIIAYNPHSRRTDS